MAADSSTDDATTRTSHPAYRSADGYSLIELKLRVIRDLFNTLESCVISAEGY